MLREIVGAAAGKLDDVDTVVVVTVDVVVVDDCGVADGKAVCADASDASAAKVNARDSFFTRVLDLGEMRAD